MQYAYQIIIYKIVSHTLQPTEALYRSQISGPRLLHTHEAPGRFPSSLQMGEFLLLGTHDVRMVLIFLFLCLWSCKDTTMMDSKCKATCQLLCHVCTPDLTDSFLICYQKPDATSCPLHEDVQSMEKTTHVFVMYEVWPTSVFHCTRITEDPAKSHRLGIYNGCPTSSCPD